MKVRVIVSSTVFVWLIAAAAHAQTLRVAWDPSADSRVAGYLIQYGTSSGQYTQAVDVGNGTEFLVQGLTPDRTYYFVVRSYTAMRTVSGASNEVSAIAPGHPLGADFSGDGRADILWQNFATGAVSLWRMQGISAAAGVPLGPGWIPDTSWKIVGAADINRDRHADVLWQHDAGHLSVWYMRGETLLSGEVITQSPVPAGWRVVATGDLDGDAYPDFLWQHTDGTVSVWYMRGAAMLSGEVIVRLSDSRWRVVAVGDFNRDGWIDLVWRHTDSGQNAIWFMKNRQRLSGELIPLPVPDQNWQVVGVTDFNVDGYPDLIWRNRSSGGLSGWTMRGHSVLANYWLNPGVVDSTWVVSGPK